MTKIVVSAGVAGPIKTTRDAPPCDSATRPPENDRFRSCTLVSGMSVRWPSTVSPRRCARAYGRRVEYTNLTADFAKRTLQNLNYVQEGALRGEAGVYEVTQLWNSLLGLIVLRHEHVINRLPMIPMNELSPQGWPLLTTAGDEPPSVPALVRCLRNAVAHFNVEFNAGTDGEIASVTMWNEKPRPIPPSRVWEGVITIRELEHLARLLANTYILAFDSTAA